MLTLIHAPMSRSTRIVQLLEALNARDKVEIRIVDIPRADGSGGPDPKNPHPEKKVPLLLHDGQMIRESNAIMVHLTTLFPDAGLAPAPGTPEHGAYLSWMAYYGNVMEPVIVGAVAGLSHPILDKSFRGPSEMHAMLASALETQPFLMGERYSAADMLLASPFLWFRQAMPDVAIIQDWAARCEAHPSFAAARAYDEPLAQAS